MEFFSKKTEKLQRNFPFLEIFSSMKKASLSSNDYLQKDIDSSSIFTAMAQRYINEKRLSNNYYQLPSCLAN